MNNTDKTHGTTVCTPNQAPGAKWKGQLKVAIDTHADFDVWMAQYEGTVPKPAQKMCRGKLVEWLGKRQTEGWEVITCYEAGPFGYGLHRALEAVGVKNHVIRPRNWDDAKRQVRTDKTDTRGMLVSLDRYVAGQREAFTVVRVPTEEEEQRRTVGRTMQMLKQTMRSVAQSARGHALYYGVRMVGAWYSDRRWAVFGPQLPESLKGTFEAIRRILMGLAKEVVGLQAKIMEGRASGEELPVGLGRETAESLEQEVCDWSRFRNRRGVGSFAGLTPGEASSGQRREQGAITKCGNGRLRWLAVQAAWRMVRYQPEYRAVKKFVERLKAGGTALRKKRLIVALAREFLVDWWRLRTGQTTAEKLGLRMTAQ